MSKAVAKKKVSAARSAEPLAVRIIKYLMLSLFGYGVVFWGGTGVLAVFKGSFDDFSPPAWIPFALIGGSVALIAAGVLSWRRLNIIAFFPAAAGTAAILAAAAWFVTTARHELETRVVSNDLLDLDKHYMYRALPVLAGGILALVLAIIQLIRRIRKKRQQQLERDNAPVRSIVD